MTGFALLAQLVEHLHGKEGVDGSSPSEGSAKAPHVGAFSFRPTCADSNVRWVWSRLWSFRVRQGPNLSSVKTTWRLGSLLAPRLPVILDQDRSGIALCLR